MVNRADMVHDCPLIFEPESAVGALIITVLIPCGTEMFVKFAANVIPLSALITPDVDIRFIGDTLMAEHFGGKNPFPAVRTLNKDLFTPKDTVIHQIQGFEHAVENPCRPLRVCPADMTLHLEGVGRVQRQEVVNNILLIHGYLHLVAHPVVDGQFLHLNSGKVPRKILCRKSRCGIEKHGHFEVIPRLPQPVYIFHVFPGNTGHAGVRFHGIQFAHIRNRQILRLQPGTLSVNGYLSPFTTIPVPLHVHQCAIGNSAQQTCLQAGFRADVQCSSVIGGYLPDFRASRHDHEHDTQAQNQGQDSSV